jgi:hypothetical protein
MKREELIYWKNKYDKEEDLDNKRDEEELRKKFQENRFITKKDLVRIVKWKFQGRLKGRQNRILNLLKNTEESFIKDVSKLALEYEDDEIRLKLFSTISGVGNAISSVILAFYDPQNYGVLDIHENFLKNLENFLLKQIYLVETLKKQFIKRI